MPSTIEDMNAAFHDAGGHGRLDTPGCVLCAFEAEWGTGEGESYQEHLDRLDAAKAINLPGYRSMT